MITKDDIERLVKDFFVVKTEAGTDYPKPDELFKVLPELTNLALAGLELREEAEKSLYSPRLTSEGVLGDALERFDTKIKG